MEVDEAVARCDDRRLKTKYRNAIYVIQRAFALYPFEEVALSFNGGKDSTVLLHLLRAGYFLHKKMEGHLSASDSDTEHEFPLRTIYFESPCAFPEINSFTYEIAKIYKLKMETLHLDFKSGLEALLKQKPTKAIFIGTRIGDPNAVGQDPFSPSSFGWPPFMRVNPILDWSYRDVWAFLLTCKVQYCSLYDKGYTSIGSIHDTVPNALLCINDTSDSREQFRPAYLLFNGRLERAGRVKRVSPHTSEVLANGLNSMNPCHSGVSTASVIAVGDEMLLGKLENCLSSMLCKKLHSIGWAVSRCTVVGNDVDSVADELEQCKSKDDMVFLYGGFGPMHSDVSVAGVAKAFGVRLAPDEEFEEYLRQLIGDQGTGDKNEMAQLPEAITELLHHEMLPVPLIKCQNVIILSSTTVSELEKEWNCLLELTSSKGPLIIPSTPFISRELRSSLFDVKIAHCLSEFRHEFPDLIIGCYRESRNGPLIISFKGKDEGRIELAVQKIRQKFPTDAISDRGE